MGRESAIADVALLLHGMGEEVESAFERTTVLDLVRLAERPVSDGSVLINLETGLVIGNVSALASTISSDMQAILPLRSKTSAQIHASGPECSPSTLGSFPAFFSKRNQYRMAGVPVGDCPAPADGGVAEKRANNDLLTVYRTRDLCGDARLSGDRQQAKSPPRDERHLEAPPEPRRSRKTARSSKSDQTAIFESANSIRPLSAPASLATVSARDLLGPTWPVFR